MGDKKERINQLEEQVNELLQQQFELRTSLKKLSYEIKSLRLKDESQMSAIPVDVPPRSSEQTSGALSETKDYPVPEKETDEEEATIPEPGFEPSYSLPSNAINQVRNLDWERFIGENIINKIGIIITVIGVGIGASYVIEHDLISPAARIAIGYIFSLGLTAVAYRLRKKYLNYSAVLMGGSMASMYVLTYLAYSLYTLFPQLVTFGLMTTITLITVGAAIGYDKQWVSIFGLVGGYAVPFLLGDENGSTLVLFSYVLFINIGVVLAAIYKYWRLLFLSAFAFTWLIFLSWFVSGPPAERDVEMSILFSSIYFLLFYATFLIYKIREKESFEAQDVATLLSNTFLYFGIGFSTLNYGLDHLQGLFTILLAGVHFGVGRIIQKYELPSHTIQNLANGLVLVFLTLAIPIQFSDQWIVMAWSLEALLLTWLGRVKRQWIFEVLAYPITILAFLSLLAYWAWYYLTLSSENTLPFANQLFVTFMVFYASFSGIQILIVKYPETTFKSSKPKILEFMGFLIPFALITTLFFDLLFEISRVFTYWEAQPAIHDLENYLRGKNLAISRFKMLWQINYTIVFLYVGSWINQKWFQKNIIQTAIFWSAAFLMGVFFLRFFDDILQLRQLYLGELDSNEFPQGIGNLLNRYIFIAFGVLNIVNIKRVLPSIRGGSKATLVFELFLSFTTIFLVSTELIQWLDLAGYDNSYKLGLSILWGICSLILIVFGIYSAKQHLRIGAMVVFSITLLKLFFYDIIHLSTISKTIVFVSLGLLLLVISFLYNHFKEKLEGKGQQLNLSAQSARSGDYPVDPEE